jgi:hypothetical protein
VDCDLPVEVCDFWAVACVLVTVVCDFCTELCERWASGWVLFVVTSLEEEVDTLVLPLAAGVLFVVVDVDLRVTSPD